MPIIFHTADIKFTLSNKLALRKFVTHQISQTPNSPLSKFPNFQLSLSFIFCSDEYLLNINRQFLNHDYYTDIITFPLTQTKEELEAEIYISIDRVKENAEKYTDDRPLTIDHRKGKASPLSLAPRPFDLELRRVIFHGILHLLGYKDKTKTQQTQMRKMENEWLKAFESFKP